MAKKFFKKSGNRRRLISSQISGIVWILVVLLLVVAVKYFSVSGDEKAAVSDSTRVEKRADLQKLEDSVYRSRRTAEHHRAPRRGRAAHGDSMMSFYSHQRPAPTRRPLMVDLNEADTTTLQLLHGIGPTLARRMVRYRERLGGYRSVNQLLEVYGFTPALLAHIAPHLTLDTARVARIPVNSASLKQLIRHPYVDYYFARDLVTLRSKGMVFSSPDDLRALPGASDTMLARLTPYLEFGSEEK